MEINELGNRKSIEKVNETKHWFLEKITKLTNFFLGDQQKKREKSHSTKTEIKVGTLLLTRQK